MWARAGTGKLREACRRRRLAAVVVADPWSVDRHFFDYREPAAVIFADDAITSRIRKEANPFRVLDVGVYQGSYLMAHRIMTMLGYHGFEIRFYDELMGGKNQWRNAGSPNLHDLLAVRYLLLPQMQEVPGFHHVLGPVTTTPGSVGVLLERDTVPAYVRVVPGAAKLPEEQVVATVVDPRFPLHSVVVLPDSASVTPEPLRPQGADSTKVRPTLAEWAPGRMRVTLRGRGAPGISGHLGELVPRLAREGGRPGAPGAPWRPHAPDRGHPQWRSRSEPRLSPPPDIGSADG